MAEFSYEWTTDLAAPVGDQVGSYTQVHRARIAEILAACSGRQGVAPGMDSELAVSTPGGLVSRVAAGGAVVDGHPYYNDSNLDLTHDATASQRADYLVLDCDWSTFNVSAAIVKGTDGTSVPPELINTPGTRVQVPLAIVTVLPGGTVSPVDARLFAAGGPSSLLSNAVTAMKIADGAVGSSKLADGAVINSKIGPAAVTAEKIANNAVINAKIADNAVTVFKIADLNVSTEKIIDGAVTAAKIADGVVTAAKIANRTRRVFLGPFDSSPIAGQLGNINSWPSLLMGDGATTTSYFSTRLPEDWTSGNVMIKYYWLAPGASAGLIGRFRITAKASSPAVSTITDFVTGVIGGTTESIAHTGSGGTGQVTTFGTTLPVAAGDLIRITVERFGADASDTLASSAYLLGVELEYTADS